MREEEDEEENEREKDWCTRGKDHLLKLPSLTLYDGSGIGHLISAHLLPYSTMWHVRTGNRMSHLRQTGEVHLPRSQPLLSADPDTPETQYQHRHRVSRANRDTILNLVLGRRSLAFCAQHLDELIFGLFAMRQETYIK